MTVKVTKKENGTAVFSIEVPYDELRPHLERAATKLATERPLAGFRPGHVPYDQAMRVFGEAVILEHAAEDAVRATLGTALDENTIETFGQPHVSIKKMAPGNPLAYDAEFTLIPEVVLPNWREIKIAQKVVTVTDAEVTNVVDELRRARATEVMVDRPAAMQDKVKIDISLALDNVPLEGGSAREHSMVLGHASVILGISEGVVGMRQGETKSFPVTFPKDHHDKNLAGRTVDAKVMLHDVFEVTLPMANDGFAQGVGKFTDLNDLRQKIYDNMLHEKQEREDERIESELLDAIVAKTTYAAFADPLIQHETDKMIAELKGSIEGEGMKWEDYLGKIRKAEPEIRTGLRPGAERRLKGALLLRQIATTEKLTASKEEITARVKELETQYAHTPELLERIQSDVYRDYQAGLIRNEKVLDLLRDQCIVEDTPVPLPT